MNFHPKGQYLEPHQTRDRAPSDYENVLGDALERAFGAGITDISRVVQELIDFGVPAPDGAAWSEELLRSELKRLGA